MRKALFQSGGLGGENRAVVVTFREERDVVFQLEQFRAFSLSYPDHSILHQKMTDPDIAAHLLDERQLGCIWCFVKVTSGSGGLTGR